MYEIELLNNICTDAGGYLHLVEIYDRIKAQHDTQVTLVFGNCKHIDANLSAVLGALLDDLHASGYNMWLAHPKSEEVRNNLSRNNFFNAFNPGCYNEDTENFIEYKKFAPHEGVEFKAYIESQLMKKQKFPAHTEKAGALIQESIMEIFVNAVSHGECSHVYSCGEYDASKNPPSLDMTIVDRGHSIPFKVNDFMKRRGGEQMSHCQAIHWALQDGNTTKDIPGGLGLSTLLEFLRLNRGAMQIVSGLGMVEFKNDKFIDYDLSKSFDGTIVNMEFNFNDDKNYRLATEPVDILNLL